MQQFFFQDTLRLFPIGLEQPLGQSLVVPLYPLLSLKVSPLAGDHFSEIISRETKLKTPDMSLKL